jgi:ABC-type sugar transport system permease subunit
MERENSSRLLYLLFGVGILLVIVSVILLIISRYTQTNAVSENIVDTGEDGLVSVYLPEKNAIVVGYTANKIRLYDTDGHITWTVETGGSVRSVCVDQTSEEIYAVCEDGTLLKLDYNGNKIGEVTLRGKGMDIAYSKQAKTLAAVYGIGVSNQRYYIGLFDRNLDKLMEYQTNMDTYAVAINQDGSSAYYGTRDSRVGKVDASGNLVWEVYTNYVVRDLAFSNVSGCLLAADENGFVYSFSDVNGEKEWEYQISNVSLAYIAADDINDVILAGDRNGKLHSLSFKGQYLGSALLGNGTVSAVTISDTDNKYIGVSGSAVVSIDSFKNKKIGSVDTGLAGVIILPAAIAAIIVIALIYQYKNNTKAHNVMHLMNKGRIAYIMLIPTFSLLVVFIYIPIISGLAGAFTNWSPARPLKFIGIDNFKKMITDVYVWVGINNMLKITFTSLAKTMIFPFLAACLITHLRSGNLKYVYRTGFILTTIVPGVASAMLWKMIFDPNIGLINNVLQVVGLGQFQRAWLGEENTAIWAIIFMGFPWIGVFPFLVFYGGLISISNEIYDSARVDGVNVFSRLFRIEIPLLTPQIRMLLLLSVIGSLQDYGGIYLLTRGGPGRSTYVPALEVFYNVSTFGEYGYASAIGLMLFVFIMLLTQLILRIPTVQDEK